MDRKTLSVSGMSCSGCADNVETALRTLAGVTRADADHETDTVEVVADEDVTDADLRAAIEGAGYDVPA